VPSQRWAAARGGGARRTPTARGKGVGRHAAGVGSSAAAVTGPGGATAGIGAGTFVARFGIVVGQRR
jgi:hypothetical protein